MGSAGLGSAPAESRQDASAGSAAEWGEQGVGWEVGRRVRGGGPLFPAASPRSIHRGETGFRSLPGTEPGFGPRCFGGIRRGVLGPHGAVFASRGSHFPER